MNACLYKGQELIQRMTDERGYFLEFPGVEHGEWEKNLIFPFEPVTRFPFSYNRFQEDGLAEFFGWSSRMGVIGRMKTGSERKKILKSSCWRSLTRMENLLQNSRKRKNNSCVNYCYGNRGFQKIFDKEITWKKSGFL